MIKSRNYELKSRNYELKSRNYSYKVVFTRENVFNRVKKS